MRLLKNDLLTFERGIIAHGCNCSNGFGSGVAKAIADKYPFVKESYHRNFNSPIGVKELQPHLLGKIQLVTIYDDELYIANCFTQLDYGKDKKQYADPIAIMESMERVSALAIALHLDVYAPKIGCGLGGLDWIEVEPIFRKISKELNNEGLELTVCYV